MHIQATHINGKPATYPIPPKYGNSIHAAIEFWRHEFHHPHIVEAFLVGDHGVIQVLGYAGNDHSYRGYLH